MSGRNDCPIVNQLEAMAYVMVQANATFPANQNQNGGADEIFGLEKFQKNNLLTFKGRYDPDRTHAWIQELRRFSGSWHVLMLIRYCLDLTCCLDKLNTGGRILARD